MTTTNPTTSPDFSVADVLAWVRTKPADEAYDYYCNRCALGQFLVAAGFPVGRFNWWGDATRSIDGESAGAFAQALAASPSTFGGLATRLEALIPEPRSVWTHPVAYLTDQSRIMANA